MKSVVISLGRSALTGLLLFGSAATSSLSAQDDAARVSGSAREVAPVSSAGAATRKAGAAAAPIALNATTEFAEIEIDGVADEADWDAARVFSGFVQREPVEGAAPEFETEVRVLFGDGAIWVAGRMWDPRPETIESRLARRDTRGSFDEFSIHLDPNLDGLTGYIFAVTAANVQRDTYLHNDSQIDDAWDAVWSSAVSIDSQGWSVEMRIPLSQIRYEASEQPQTWGVNFYRRRIANNETTFYSLVSQLRRGIVSQMGRMDNVLVTRPSRRLEVLPYVVSSLHRGPSDPGDPFFDGSDTGGRFGMDLSYGLGAAFTLDATINPDFGQVEADPAVINLTAFETFFQERRPFFVEDARVFDFTLSGEANKLFYSRRVGRSPNGAAPSDADYSDVPSNATILGAAKLAGRTSSGLSIGALAAVTGNEFGQGQFADGSRSDFLVEPRGNFGVVSLAQDLNEGMTQVRGIGTMMRRDLPADGSFDWLPSSAFNGGLRFEHQWNDREWAFYGFLVGSHVRGNQAAIARIQNASNHYFDRPDATRFALDPTRTSISGREWRAQLEKRGGEHWTGAIWAAEVSKGFQINDLGFSQTAERLDGGSALGTERSSPATCFGATTSRSTASTTGATRPSTTRGRSTHGIVPARQATTASTRTRSS